LLAAARTSTYRTVCRRGGTEEAKRQSRESGSRSTATVPSARGFFERDTHEAVGCVRDALLRHGGAL
jgi:hypothetical protein